MGIVAFSPLALADFNENRVIDAEDVFQFACLWGSDRESERYSEAGGKGDMNRDGAIDEFDLFLFISLWHQVHDQEIAPPTPATPDASPSPR